MSLTKQQKLFVDAYDGDEVYAAKIAGYAGSDQYLKTIASKLMANPKVVQAIKERSQYVAATYRAIADRQERQSLWTSIMRNEDPYRKEEKDSNGVPIPEGNIPLPVRLKASELLGKSEADFIEKLDVSSNVTITDIIAQSYSIEDDVDSIEAQYKLLKERKENPVIEDAIASSESQSESSLEDFI
jgi:phage terminase small subunit